MSSARRRIFGPSEALVILSAANDTDDDVAVTVSSAAKILACDQSTVRELVRRGLIAGFRVGKSDKPTAIRIKLWSIREWEETHAITPIGGRSPHPPTSHTRSSPTKINRADVDAAAWLKSRGA